MRSDFKISIVGLAETTLATKLDEFYDVNGYEMSRRDRFRLYDKVFYETWELALEHPRLFIEFDEVSTVYEDKYGVLCEDDELFIPYSNKIEL